MVEGILVYFKFSTVIILEIVTASGSTDDDLELDSSSKNTGFNFTFGDGSIDVDSDSDFRLMNSLNIRFVDENGDAFFRIRY